MSITISQSPKNITSSEVEEIISELCAHRDIILDLDAAAQTYITLQQTGTGQYTYNSGVLTITGQNKSTTISVEENGVFENNNSQLDSFYKKATHILCLTKEERNSII